MPVDVRSSVGAYVINSQHRVVGSLIRAAFDLTKARILKSVGDGFEIIAIFMGQAKHPRMGSDAGVTQETLHTSADVPFRPSGFAASCEEASVVVDVCLDRRFNVGNNDPYLPARGEDTVSTPCEC